MKDHGDWVLRKVRKMHTFHHGSCGKSVVSTFEVAGCVVKKPEALCIAPCLSFEDIYSMFDLCHKIAVIEPTVTIFPRLEKDAGSPFWTANDCQQI